MSNKNKHSTNDEVRLIAFYLPQFHPIPENDLWWGKGFTEWTNVAKALPLFYDHHQPHLPADLGFYDLRLPEAREAQAALAQQYGVYGFCYYYYWFNGRRLLERPLNEVLISGQPKFPFCVCWANESWSRRWDGGNQAILVEQKHSPEDDLAFISSLVALFRDERYIRINGNPLLLVYRVDLFPDPMRTAEIWREAMLKAGIGELYLVRVESFKNRGNPEEIGFDASTEFAGHQLPPTVQLRPTSAPPTFQGGVIDYPKYAEYMSTREAPAYKRFRSVMPSWDNTARMGNNPIYFHNSSPAQYLTWLSKTVNQTRQEFQGDERLVFVNAWNEWGEGCHLEPDQKYGLQFLEATLSALK